MTTTSPPPASRRGLELITVFFASTTVALIAGVVVAVYQAPAIVVLGAGGTSLGVAFGIGLKVFEHLNAGN